MLISFFGFFLFVVSPAYAVQGTMSLQPVTGSHTVGKSFTADLILDGQNDAFNAAKGTVALSPNLELNDVLLGDCNFSFILTPSLADISFAGVILGQSKKSCTVYTLTITPQTSGTGSITISNASLKKYGDGSELLNSVANGSYLLTGSGSTTNDPSLSVQSAASNQSTTTVLDNTPQENIQSYTLSVKVMEDTDTPISDATVIVEPSVPSSESQMQPSGAPMQVQTDANGIAQIKNVSPGVHTIAVEYQGKPIAKNIVNVSGKYPVLVMGIKKETPPTSPYGMSIFIPVSILLLLTIVFLLRRRIKSFFKKDAKTPISSEDNNGVAS